MVYTLRDDRDDRGVIDMRTLIIVAHPDVKGSMSQQFFLSGLEQEQTVTLHQLYDSYPDSKVDKVKEVDLLLSHDRIIFQFPLYWYSAPSLLKEWQDVVLSEIASNDSYMTQIAGKEFGIVVSIGAKETSYQAGGSIGLSLSELMKPYQAMATYFGLHFMPIFSNYQFMYQTEEAKKQLLVDYQYYVTGPKLKTLANRTEWLKTRVMSSQTLDAHLLEPLLTQLEENYETIEDLNQTLADM